MALPVYDETAAPADRLQRPLRDLRISVTDRCNFRCTYCMPKEIFGRDYQFLAHRDILSFEEITRLTRIFIAAGVEKVRITGGEPLLRRDIDVLVGMLAELPGLNDLTLTTNGSLLAQKAGALRAAGLQRVSVSLDALDDETFKSMNDVDFPVALVLRGIDAAAAAGLAPIKINAVVKRGSNDGAIVALARHFRGSGHILRFIEYMDVGNSNGWRLDDVMPAEEIYAVLDAVFPLEALEPNYPGEVARRYRYCDGLGEIGIIASVSHPFCGDCTRARLSSDGQLYTCLFASVGHDLRLLLRNGSSDAEIARMVGTLWRKRADRYSELRARATPALTKVEMSRIGG